LPGELVREGWRELDSLPSLRQTVGGLENPRLAISALETSWYMRNQLLRDADWASMAHSLEVRVPLVDIELVLTVAQLVKSGQAPDKKAMTGSPGKAIPPAVLQWRKNGFAIPIREWLLQSAPENDGQSDRGLRGWATKLYANSGYVPSGQATAAV
jgi:asparagine synthase (glutamine-hydrolysing)